MTRRSEASADLRLPLVLMVGGGLSNHDEEK
jgi:hypothetical protein